LHVVVTGPAGDILDADERVGSNAGARRLARAQIDDDALSD
jgi:hypothetical protein